MGSRVLEHAMPSADSLYVARMKAAGCIVIGKTNMPEFGLGSHTIAQGPQSFVPAGLPAPGQFRIGWLGDLRDHLATERGCLAGVLEAL